jgi:hypothetical protein
VVASASEPREASSLADPASHGFGISSGSPGRWRSRKRFASSLMRSVSPTRRPVAHPDVIGRDADASSPQRAEQPQSRSRVARTPRSPTEPGRFAPSPTCLLQLSAEIPCVGRRTAVEDVVGDLYRPSADMRDSVGAGTSCRRDRRRRRGLVTIGSRSGGQLEGQRGRPRRSRCSCGLVRAEFGGGRHHRCAPGVDGGEDLVGVDAFRPRVGAWRTLCQGLLRPGGRTDHPSGCAGVRARPRRHDTAVSVTSASLVEHVSTQPHCLLEASVDASSDQTPAPDDKQAW